MYDLIDLKNKTILITGASSGIGKGIVELLDKLEAKVIMVARREDRLKEIKKGLNNKESTYYVADLSNLDKIEDLVEKVVLEHGALNGFVHSAGITSARPLKAIKPDILNNVMTVNFYSFIELCRCITMKKRFSMKGLSVVGISSTSSIQGNSSRTAYSASKAAMDAAVRCMAKELSQKKIRLNTVAPAFIDTEIFESFLNYGENEEDSKMVLARQYLGIGKPEDVANVVAFLLSDASRFITGATIGVDGGKLTW